MGTGVVGFNLGAEDALMCDLNPHLIRFYEALASSEITPPGVRGFLEKEGSLLSESGGEHYYAVRERFNEKHSPLDFLFLSRACFNGMIRFNRKGSFNVPFCKKRDRFGKAYVTKIVNQVDHLHRLFKLRSITFKHQDFRNTIQEASDGDLIYCDPPYIGRHTDYYNGWNEDDEKSLFELLSETKSFFILSTWHHNSHRENLFIRKYWSKFNIHTREHFYHVGAREDNRNAVTEALITNFQTHASKPPLPVSEQLSLNL